MTSKKGYRYCEVVEWTNKPLVIKAVRKHEGGVFGPMATVTRVNRGVFHVERASGKTATFGAPQRVLVNEHALLLLALQWGTRCDGVVQNAAIRMIEGS